MLQEEIILPVIIMPWIRVKYSLVINLKNQVRLHLKNLIYLKDNMRYY